jgi:putative ABC transport system permease protein
MISNYFRTAIRSLSRDKTYTIIHLIGLSVGLAAFILVSAYVHFEKSYDRMFAGEEHIYRVESLFYKDSQLTDNWATSTNGYAAALKDNFPEIESFARINWHDAERVVRYKDITSREAHVCFADTNFLSFFSYPLLKGDRTTALRDVNTVVLSASSARKYFGNADPYGAIPGHRHHLRQLSLYGDGYFPGSAPEFNHAVQYADLMGHQP